MPNMSLEPILNTTSPESTSLQSYPAYQQTLPENSFESTLASVEGNVDLFSFLGSDGLALANAENPTFGGSVVSTAISNLGTGNPFNSGYGVGAAGYAGGLRGGGGYGAALPNALSTNPAFNGGGGGFGGGGSTVDGFGPTDVKGAILDEGLQQIMLMVQVQQAARTLDAMSNILKTQHDATMNTIRNIRS